MNKKNKLSVIFKVLSDENRLRILTLVHRQKLKCPSEKEGQCEKRTCINDLNKQLKISLPTVSHHVKELVNAGILTIKKEGRWSYLQTNPKSLKEAADFLLLF